jgi:hypothetical protein
MLQVPRMSPPCATTPANQPIESDRELFNPKPLPGDIMDLPHGSKHRNYPLQSEEEKLEERKKLRRLQMMVNMVHSTLSQDPDLTLREAFSMISNCKSAALAMFPGKELAFDLIYKPRLQRVIDERFGGI